MNTISRKIRYDVIWKKGNREQVQVPNTTPGRHLGGVSYRYRRGKNVCHRNAAQPCSITYNGSIVREDISDVIELHYTAN